MTSVSERTTYAAAAASPPPTVTNHVLAPPSVTMFTMMSSESRLTASNAPSLMSPMLDEYEVGGHFYFVPSIGAKYNDRSVCLSVCLSARISQKPHAQMSPNVLYMLPVAVTQFSSNGSAISYVFTWMTSCFHINIWRHRWRCLPSVN